MRRADREERLETIKTLGRIAYRHLKDAEIVGVITVDGDEKRLRSFDENGLSAKLLMPFRAWALQTEHSQIEIRAYGRKVFDIRWDRAGNLKTIHFEAGEWEMVLIDMPEPIAFG